MASQIDIKISKNAKMIEIVARQSKQIVKLEAGCSTLFELVLGLTRSLHSLFSHLKVSIGFVPIALKDEEIVQKSQGDMEMENAEVKIKLQADIK